MMFQKYLPLWRDESKTQRQEQPISHKGKWVDQTEVTAENKENCELLVKRAPGCFRITE
jgi:hypothetical protein